MKVYEAAYAFFDPISSESPDHGNCEVDVSDNGFYSTISNLDSTLNPSDEGHVDDVDVQDSALAPKHVQSVKSLHDNNLISGLNNPVPNLSADEITTSAEMFTSQGEGNHVPEHLIHD